MSVLSRPSKSFFVGYSHAFECVFSFNHVKIRRKSSRSEEEAKLALFQFKVEVLGIHMLRIVMTSQF